MEKLTLTNAVGNRILDISAKNIEKVSNYLPDSNEYENKFKNIGKDRSFARKLVFVIGLILLVISFETFKTGTLSAIFMISAFVTYIIYGSLTEDHKVKDSSEKQQLKNEIINKLLEHNFKELLDYANGNTDILIAAFDKARINEVPEDKIEAYIKGFILQKLDEIELKAQRKLKEIEDVIEYEQSPKRKEIQNFQKLEEQKNSTNN